MKQKIIARNTRQGEEFQMLCSPTADATAPFIAFGEQEIIVTKTFSEIRHLPAKTVVAACWHGQYRTDAFMTTVGALSVLADAVLKEREERRLAGVEARRQAKLEKGK